MENGNQFGVEGNNPKVVSIISYLFLIGWIIAFLLNRPRHPVVSFHLRQSLAISLLFIAARFLFIIPFIGWFAGIILIIISFLLWIIGILAAAKGEEKIVPFIGELAQDWFRGI
jgi:uncharacterized membrane protein